MKPDKIKNRPARTTYIFEASVETKGDIFPTRECKLTLTKHNFHNGPLGKVHHFSAQYGGGMAFPEVLRAYAELFNRAADFVEGKEPIDFQI